MARQIFEVLHERGDAEESARRHVAFVNTLCALEGLVVSLFRKDVQLLSALQELDGCGDDRGGAYSSLANRVSDRADDTRRQRRRNVGLLSKSHVR